MTGERALKLNRPVVVGALNYFAKTLVQQSLIGCQEMASF